MKHLLFLILILISNQVFSQNINKDSLLNEWNNKQLNDTIRLQSLDKLAFDGFVSTAPDSTIYYAKKGLILSNKLNFGEFQGKFNYSIGVANYVKSNFDTAEVYFIRSNELFKKNNATPMLYTSSRMLAGVFKEKGKNQEALDILFQLINDYGKLASKPRLANTYSDIGANYIAVSKYEEAKIYYIKALDLFNEDKNTNVANLHLRLSNLYRKLNDKELALKHSLLCLKNAEENNNDYQKGLALGNLANFYDQYSEYSNALEYHIKAIELYKKMDNKKELAKQFNNIGNTHLRLEEYDKAIYYYNESLVIKKELGYEKGMSISYLALGAVYTHLSNLKKANEYYIKALKIMEKIGNEDEIAILYANIGNNYSSQNFNEKAIEYYNKSIHTSKAIGELGEKNLAFAIIGLGTIASKEENHEQAINYNKEALAISEKIEDNINRIICLNNLGHEYIKLKQYNKAKEYLLKALELIEKQDFDDIKNISSTYRHLGNLYLELKNYSKAQQYANRSLTLAKKIESIKHIKDASELLYKIHKELGNKSKAFDHYEMYILMKDSLLNEENQRLLLQKEYEYNYEKQYLADSLSFAKEQAIKDLEIAEQQANISKQRIALFSSGIGLLLVGFLSFFIYKGKKRSDELLLNILPYETAQELKRKGSAAAKEYEKVTVLFTDFKGFTQAASRMSPKELVAEINECFKAFDQITEKYKIEKIKTIGDAYMAASGLPTKNQTHPQDVVNAAIEIRDFMLDLRKRKGENTFEIRIGIHTGPVIAGIVGIKKFQYDIWGDTVNIASRMESNSQAGKINISHATYELVKDQYNCEYRGEIQAKGKGLVKMYFVDSKS